MRLAEIIHCIDLTRLVVADQAAAIQMLCQQADTPIGKVAAICIYSDWLQLAKSLTAIPIATVINFPQGDQSLSAVVAAIRHAIDNGAQEIDMVMPYQKYDKINNNKIQDFVASAKRACGNHCLKVILETGVLTTAQIAKASMDAIIGGADFLKTSTGKAPVGATPQAVKIMLAAIRDANRPVGIKISGGIRTLGQAQSYVDLYQRFLGRDTVDPTDFRIGSSQLLCADT